MNQARLAKAGRKLDFAGHRIILGTELAGPVNRG
jgi:hypothetical protein